MSATDVRATAYQNGLINSDSDIEEAMERIGKSPQRPSDAAIQMLAERLARKTAAELRSDVESGNDYADMGETIEEIGATRTWQIYREAYASGLAARIRSRLAHRARGQIRRKATGPTKKHLDADARDFSYITREAKDIQRAVKRLEARDRPHRTKGRREGPSSFANAVLDTIARRLRPGQYVFLTHTRNAGESYTREDEAELNARLKPRGLKLVHDKRGVRVTRINQPRR